MSFSNYQYFQKNNNLNSVNSKQSKKPNILNNNYPINLNYNQKYYENNNYFNPNNDIADIEEEKNENDDNYFENNFRNEQKELEKQYNISNKVMEDFKKIMEQTKIIKDKILLKSHDIENNIFNKSYFIPKINKINSNFLNIKTKIKKDYNPDINYNYNNIIMI